MQNPKYKIGDIVIVANRNSERVEDEYFQIEIISARLAEADFWRYGYVENGKKTEIKEMSILSLTGEGVEDKFREDRIDETLAAIEDEVNAETRTPFRLAHLSETLKHLCEEKC